MKHRFAPSHVRDQIAFFANAADLRKPALYVIDGLQKSDAKPGLQMLAAATALLALCESANIPVNEVLTKASRALRDAEGPYSTHIRAIRDYATREIARGE